MSLILLQIGCTREARYATVSFEQNRYSVFENHVMRKKSTYDNKLTVRNNIVLCSGNSGVVKGLDCLAMAEGLMLLLVVNFFSTELVYFLWANRKFFFYSGWGRVGVIK